jgi:hypothetical protein
MVPISPEIYSSTAVVMDNRGLADYIARTQQRLAAQKAAKDEALDKYFNDLQNKINTAGVRTQDLKMNPANPNSPGILTDIEQWGNNWMQNKEAIRKGGLPQQQYLNKFQEIIRKIQQSKDRAKTSDEINKLRIEGKIDEEDFPTVQKIDASIYDPRGYKEDGITEYSLGDFSAFVPTWDVPKRKQYIDFAASGIDPAGRINEKTVVDSYTGNKVTTFDKVYTQDQLKKMAEKAIAIGSDKSGLKTYKNLLKEGERDIPSEEFISLAKAYNSVFRDDAMDTPLKVAAADIILNKMGVVGTGRTAEGRPSKGTTINFGGGAGETVRNLYDDVKALANRAAQKDLGAAMNEVPSADAQIKLIQIAQKAKNDSNLSQKNTYLKVEPDGVLWIYKVTKRDSKGGAIQGERITRVTKEDLDLPFQPGVAEERQVIAGAKKEVQKVVPAKKPVALKGVPQGGF